MSVQRDLEAAFVAHAGAIAGVANAEDHEPEKLPRLPAVTMLALPAAQADVATGGIVERTFTWRVMLYVGLGDGYRSAQHELGDLVELLLAITVDDFNAGGLCDHWQLTGDGSEPQFAHAEGWVFQRLRLTATVETR